MATGVTTGGKYLLNGFYGTAQEHAARQKSQRTQEPYDASAPSSGAASTAARGVNPNLDFNISPTGATSLSNQSEQQRKMLELQQQLSNETAERDRFNQMQDRNSFFAKLNQEPAAGQPRISHPGAGPSSEADARAAAFSRAKDQAGRIARSSLTAIAENMASKGMSGASIQALQEAGAIGGAGDALQELTRDQMISDVNRAAEIADLEYTGGITQRGQDLSNRQSYLALLGTLY